MAHADASVQEGRVVSQERLSQDFITIFADLLARRLYKRPPSYSPSLYVSLVLVVMFSYIRGSERGVTKAEGEGKSSHSIALSFCPAGRMRGREITDVGSTTQPLTLIEGCFAVGCGVGGWVNLKTELSTPFEGFTRRV